MNPTNNIMAIGEADLEVLRAIQRLRGPTIREVANDLNRSLGWTRNRARRLKSFNKILWLRPDEMVDAYDLGMRVTPSGYYEIQKQRTGDEEAYEPKDRTLDAETLKAIQDAEIIARNQLLGEPLPTSPPEPFPRKYHA